MIFVTNLFYMPFLLLIWLIEAYLLLTVARLIIAAVPSARTSHLYHQLKLLVDPIPNKLRWHLAKWLKARIPSSLPWLIVVSGGCVVRQMLITLITM
jgi:hypothetical protein